ncbi:hypothetical protein AMC82_PD00644 (plasmid) [Rhizobium phaseoli]|uniref:hypothetical protein n=1 Tax=Rhizobium phaseoli TaxID=396 RepID=UPI0007EC0690|nr:hypothetical protein [Rhizobium phaseoli]ANL44052.1 hypothetical protein AMC88_PD00209 [Rhizobium phaseoli]ANL63015.1 hypothetical protein AMC85_PD00209 [Rhizobium phaseoli]ANL69603.1 hypothetical protein AMC84_PD00645 [Rhizobium phaseoli]ANL82401.1 hypothetical protein AMC82_PD00644 [Rhizobium phaseoli]ANM08140.1 hypothetical protein AMC78_PD00631 [Rhizobium phaseoli]
MTLVTSGGWIPEANERRGVRDEVRSRFQGRVGVQPFSSMAELSFSPEQQVSVVQELMFKANPQNSADIARGLWALSAALGSVGLGAGGLMAAVGATSLKFNDLVPQELHKWHFLEEDVDG